MRPDPILTKKQQVNHCVLGQNSQVYLFPQLYSIKRLTLVKTSLFNTEEVTEQGFVPDPSVQLPKRTSENSPSPGLQG